MTQIEIYTATKKIIENILAHHNNRLIIAPESHLKNDIQFCDADIQILFTELEQFFGIDIYELEADKIETVNDILVLMLHKLEIKNGK